VTLAFRGISLSTEIDWSGGATRMGWTGASGRRVTRREARSHSAYWGCIRLRADIISTLPIDTYRKVNGIQVEVPKSPVLIAPDGDKMDVTEFMYSTQADLDGTGNAFGIIREKDSFGIPSRIDLVPVEEVTVQVRKGVVTYAIAGDVLAAEDVWHEKQWTTSGLVVGLSPVAYAAMTLNQFLSARDFAVSWFAGGAIPTGVLKNDAVKLDPRDTAATKARFRLAIENGDVFVTGKDWDYKVIEAQASQASFLEAMRSTDIDVCRYLGVPADMIDASQDAGRSSITYANITQRNLQLLIINLAPAIIRREKALSRLTVGDRFVKLNTDALLRMDPQTASLVLGQQIKDRMTAPSEARALLNREPFTADQEAEFDRLFPTRNNTTPTTSSQGA
jgi:HK97 family phage portal protein